MCRRVNTVSQSADGHDVALFHVFQDFGHAPYAVSGGVAGAHHGQHPWSLEVAVSQIVEHQWGIRTPFQSGGVGGIQIAAELDVVFFHKAQFFVHRFTKGVVELDFDLEAFAALQFLSPRIGVFKYVAG